MALSAGDVSAGSARGLRGLCLSALLLLEANVQEWPLHSRLASGLVWLERLEVLGHFLFLRGLPTCVSSQSGDFSVDGMLIRSWLTQGLGRVSQSQHPSHFGTDSFLVSG